MGKISFMINLQKKITDSGGKATRFHLFPVSRVGAILCCVRKGTDLVHRKWTPNAGIGALKMFISTNVTEQRFSALCENGKYLQTNNQTIIPTNSP